MFAGAVMHPAAYCSRASEKSRSLPEKTARSLPKRVPSWLAKMGSPDESFKPANCSGNASLSRERRSSEKGTPVSGGI